MSSDVAGSSVLDGGGQAAAAARRASVDVRPVTELADLEALEAQMSQSGFGSTLDDVDVDLLEQRLGHEAVRDFQALRDLERELEEQGYLSRGDDGDILVASGLGSTVTLSDDIAHAFRVSPTA